jgi:hypothetical protein
MPFFLFPYFTIIFLLAFGLGMLHSSIWWAFWFVTTDLTTIGRSLGNASNINPEKKV